MSKAEMAIVNPIFRESINLGKVCIDEHAHVACKRHRLKYVSFYTINSWGKMDYQMLVHELVHVWQYEQMGAAYIPLALFAQRSKMGYDYGGIVALKDAIRSGRGLHAFNLEQQASIIQDFYSLSIGCQPEWCTDLSGDEIHIFKSFVDQLNGISEMG